VRVVAGVARGRPLRSPEGEGTRPTSDRVREALFNALFSRSAIQGASVADLFAGSGALGIEALSRGAAHCWFVEHDRRAVAVIDHNLDTLGFRASATVLQGDVDAQLGHLPEDLDLVLADPPYAFDAWPALLARLAPHLGPEGIVVVESDRSVTVPERWQKVRERTYGGTVIAFTAPSPAPGVDA
jgi:16S rRNA (guanine966-N2)-methyltransferase